MSPTSTNHWGMFVLAATPHRPDVVIQCPHPLYDSQTGKQGAFVFLATGSLGYVVSGTHRCSSLSPSACSGTTSVCTGSTEPYRISDQAHVVSSPFHRATEMLALRNPRSVFIQLHGFAQGTGDPDVIMSNGTRQTPAQDYSVAIRNGLLQEDPTLTFKIVHIDLTWMRLTAFDNTQGRHLNGSPNPCSQTASATSGRFVHIEQAFEKLRSSEQNWRKMANAIATAFPSTLDAEEPHDQSSAVGQSEFLGSYPNPCNPAATISISLSRRGYATVRIFDILGRPVTTIHSGALDAGRHDLRWDAQSLTSGVYVCELIAQSSRLARRIVVLK